MKMSQAHYAVLKDRLAPIVKSGELNLHIARIKQSGKYKDLATRVLWDAFHACRMYDKYTYQEFDYNDKHVETAMRKAFSELGVVIE